MEIAEGTFANVTAMEARTGQQAAPAGEARNCVEAGHVGMDFSVGSMVQFNRS